jgi:hypothetical protein
LTTILLLKIVSFLVRKPKDFGLNPPETEENPETHHNSPQKPKFDFSTGDWSNHRH